MPGPGWKAAVEPTLSTPPPAALDHAGQEQAGQVREGRHVHLEHVQLLLKRQRGDRAPGRYEAGIVDDDVDREALGRKLLEDRLGRFGVGQIGRQRAGLDPLPLPEFSGQLLQFLPVAPPLAPGGFCRRRTIGQFPTDAGGGPGDQRGFSCHVPLPDGCHDAVQETTRPLQLPVLVRFT